MICCGIFHCVWNISASPGSINNQDCIFHFLRFIAFVHSYITIVLNILLKITMFTSFIATTSKRLDYVCPAANRTWQRLIIISCDLTHERDTYGPVCRQSFRDVSFLPSFAEASYTILNFVVSASLRMTA